MRVRNLLVSCPEETVDKAHEIYKARGGEYARFMNRGPLRVANDELWNQILFELKPDLFH